MAYSPELKNAMEISSSIAREYSHNTWGPSHLLKALLHNDIGLATLLVIASKGYSLFKGVGGCTVGKLSQVIENGGITRTR